MLRKTLNETSNTPVRRCILTGDRAAQGVLVRLAIDPEGMIAPDVRAKAPGRGAWIGVDGATLCEALNNGKLRGALARAFKGASLTLPDDLTDKIALEMKNAVLNRLGLESRGGYVLTGSEKIAAAARSGQLFALYHSADAREDGRRKLDQAWRVGSDSEGNGLQGTIIPADRGAISAALGKENAVHIGINDKKSAQRLEHHLRRWINFTGCSIDPDNNRLKCDADASFTNQNIRTRSVR